MTQNEIIVGLDDSPAGKAALRWAADQAILRQAILRAIHVFDWPYGPSDTTYTPQRDVNMTFDETHATYLAGITKVFDEIAPRPDWLIEFGKGKPGPLLVKESRDSQLLVVGTREHVGLGRLLSGSVSHYCLSHAACPVVSVPTLTNAGPVELADEGATGGGSNANEIVVGVDLSSSARLALAWAAEQARATGLSLLAVHAVDVSPAFSIRRGKRAVAMPVDPSELNSAHRESIAAVFDSIQPEPDWHLEFFSGKAGPVLAAVSDGATMLVVGTEEHVGIGRLVSGSVSHHCLGRAPAPVVAVPKVGGKGGDQDNDHAPADRPAAD
jgi:nucleotide-binding universal stress UspA family protein